MDRQSYIGAILSNCGLGPDKSEQTAQQVDQMFTEHKRKINEFTQQRERLIQSGFKHKQMMNTQQEQMHERRKAQLLKQVERQAKVGLGLMRLKAVNFALSKDLQESIEFNERIEDPVGWKRKIKLR